MGLLASGGAWLRTQRASEAVSATYRRGALSAALNVVQGATTSQADDGDVIVESRAIDWLIERAELVLDGELVEPEIGDRVGVEFDHGLEWFTVVALGGEPCFRWHGRDGGTFRVHSVKTPYVPPVHVTADDGLLRSDVVSVLASG